MRRIPIIPTLVVLLALGTMIALGIWQLQRARWKEQLLQTYQSSRNAPDLYGLPVGADPDRIAFRHAHILCRVTTKETLLGGVDAKGRTGFRAIVGCALIDGRIVMADLGWKAIDARPQLPAIGQRIEGRGLLIPDEVLARRVLGDKPGTVPLLVVLDGGVPGLSASVPPSIEMIPNNHRSYAVQWFLFAAVALVIYAIALWKRTRGR